LIRCQGLPNHAIGERDWVRSRENRTLSHLSKRGDDPRPPTKTKEDHSTRDRAAPLVRVCTLGAPHPDNRKDCPLSLTFLPSSVTVSPSPTIESIKPHATVSGSIGVLFQNCASSSDCPGVYKHQVDSNIAFPVSNPAVEITRTVQASYDLARLLRPGATAVT
jgi:hypothetical protein